MIGCQVLASLCYSVRGWLLGPACSPAPRAQTIFIADVDMIIGRTLAVVLLCEVSAQWLFALNFFLFNPKAAGLVCCAVAAVDPNTTSWPITDTTLDSSTQRLAHFIPAWEEASCCPAANRFTGQITR